MYLLHFTDHKGKANMKRYILIILALITFFVVISHPSVAAALLLFLFLGIIPGTNITVPFWVLLPTYTIGAIILMYWLSTQPLYIGSQASQGQTARNLARKKIVPAKAHVKKRSTKRRLAAVKN